MKSQGKLQQGNSKIYSLVVILEFTEKFTEIVPPKWLRAKTCICEDHAISVHGIFQKNLLGSVFCNHLQWLRAFILNRLKPESTAGIPVQLIKERLKYYLTPSFFVISSLYLKAPPPF